MGLKDIKTGEKIVQIHDNSCCFLFCLIFFKICVEDRVTE